MSAEETKYKASGTLSRDDHVSGPSALVPETSGDAKQVRETQRAHAITKKEQDKEGSWLKSPNSGNWRPDLTTPNNKSNTRADRVRTTPPPPPIGFEGLYKHELPKDNERMKAAYDLLHSEHQRLKMEVHVEKLEGQFRRLEQENSQLLNENKDLHGQLRLWKNRTEEIEQHNMQLGEDMAKVEAKLLGREEDIKELIAAKEQADAVAQQRETELRLQIEEMGRMISYQNASLTKYFEDVQMKKNLQSNPFHLGAPQNVPPSPEHQKEKEERRKDRRERRKTIKKEQQSDPTADSSSDSSSPSGSTDTDNSSCRSHKRRKREKKRKARSETTRGAGLNDSDKDATSDMDGQVKANSKHLKLILQWSKMVPEIARSVPKLKGKEDLYKWRKVWHKRCERFRFIKRKWLRVPRNGTTVEHKIPEDETLEEQEIRKAVAAAILSTIDTSNDEIKAWMDDANELHPRSVYCRAVQYCQEMNIKSCNQLSTAFTSSTMISTGANILNYGKVMKELARRQAELGEEVNAKRACETYLLGLLPQFDPIRDELRKQHQADNDYDLVKTVRAVEDWATNARADRELTNLTHSNKNKIDTKLVAEIKALTGETTAKVVTTNTANVSPQKKQTHPLGQKGCYYWWAHGECRYGTNCNKVATHTEAYKGKGKQSDAKAPTSTSSRTKADKYKDHTCESCGAKGHSKAWKKCPGKLTKASDTNVNTTLSATTSTKITPAAAPGMDDVIQMVKVLKQGQDKLFSMMAKAYQDTPDPSNLMSFPSSSLNA